MAAALKKEMGIEADLMPGDGGIFDVEREGELIFSKHDQGRYPENDEIVALLRRPA